MKYLLSNNHFRLTNKLSSYTEENPSNELEKIPYIDEEDVKKVIYDIYQSKKNYIDSMEDFLTAFKD